VSRLTSLRPLARLAWRDAARYPGRGLLMAAMLALPTAELAGATVLLRNGPLKGSMSLGGNDPFLMLWLATLGAAALTVVAALSVGAARQLRELSLLAASGAGRWQLRALLLLEAAGLGLVGAVAGILGGLALTWAAFLVMRGWLEPVTDEHLNLLAPQFSVRASDLRWVLAFTVTVALLAALGPARRAARLPAPAGRHQPAGRRRRRPAVLAAAALVLVGIAVQLLAAQLLYRGAVPPAALQVLVGDGGTINVGSLLLLAGAALSAPALVGLVGRHPPRRPTVLRLAARDAAGHPGRSGPTVAAIAVGLGLLVVLAGQVPNHSFFNGFEYLPEPLLWSPPFPLALRVLLALVAGITVLVVLAVTALGRAEAEAELATLSAVGAGPGTLRGLAAASAWLLTQAGAVLGTLAAGSLLAAQRAAGLLGVPVFWPAPVPWVVLALVLFAVPALAALAGAATTRAAAPPQRAW
jgi:FtsX-like permease family